MRNSFLIITFILICNIGKSQENGGFELYYYTGAGESTLVPKVYYQRHNWYGEVRYNYEELQTVSFNVGKMFSNKKIN